MTPKRKEILEYIHKTIDETGVCPSYREIALHMCLKSPSNVHAYIHRLINDGYLEWEGNVHTRNLMLTDKGLTVCEVRRCKHCNRKI